MSDAGGNGHGLPGPCAAHDAAITQHDDDIAQLRDRQREVENERIAEQERWRSVSRQASDAAVASRAASDHAKAAVNATVALSTKVDQLRDGMDNALSALTTAVAGLADRVRDLERPRLPSVDTSELAFVGGDTARYAVGPEGLFLLRELNTSREALEEAERKAHEAEVRAAAAESALKTRERQSEHENLKSEARWKRTAWLVTKALGAIGVLAWLGFNTYLQLHNKPPVEIPAHVGGK